MKRTSKVVLLALCMVLVFSTLAVASTSSWNVTATVSPDIKISLNGQQQNLKDGAGAAVHPVIINGSTYLPVRAIGDLTGVVVDWDAGTKTVILNQGGVIAPPKVDEPYKDAQNYGTTSLFDVSSEVANHIAADKIISKTTADTMRNGENHQSVTKQRLSDYVGYGKEYHFQFATVFNTNKAYKEANIIFWPSEDISVDFRILGTNDKKISNDKNWELLNETTYNPQSGTYGELNANIAGYDRIILQMKKSNPDASGEPLMVISSKSTLR